MRKSFFFPRCEKQWCRSAGHLHRIDSLKSRYKKFTHIHRLLRPYIFLILGLQIFFQNIKVGGGKKIKKNY